jgi:hypothetical protein
MNDNTANKDLVWELDRFQQRQKATDFAQQFKNKLCVYSRSVEQLYSNYDMLVDTDDANQLHILPDQFAYHDTFFNVSGHSVSATGLSIISGEVVGREGLHITVPTKDRSGQRKVKALPLQEGLELINDTYLSDQRFLPVVEKGDLREFKANAPMLHLHRIQIDLLRERSAMERASIEGTIEEMLPQLA